MDRRPAKRTTRGWTDIADRIARDIRSGVFVPGMWLKQIDLEQRYLCSRPDVRRALDQLAQRRIVEHVPNRGYHVFAPDDARAAQLLEVRVILETGVAEVVVANASASDVAALRALAGRFAQLMRTGTVLELYEANLAFHAAILALGGNPELARLVAELRSRTPAAPAGQWRTLARIETSCQEHRRMVEAIASGDAAGLRTLITAHIRQRPLPV